MRFFFLLFIERQYVKLAKVVGKNILTSDNFIIFPIQHFHKYFDVSAKYRVKKSGSNSPSKNSLIEIEDILKRNNLHYSNLHFNSTKLFVQIPERSEKFQMNGINYDYQFNPQNDGYFEIRRLSNTKNANVIHSERLSRNIHLTPPLSLSSSHTAYINRVQNDIKLDDTLIDSFNYIHCRNCFAFLAKESKILYNN